MALPLAAKRGGATSSVVALMRAPLLLCFALLMSCGGGGGGGGRGDGGDDSLRITLNRRTVTWTLLEGQTPTPETITGTATGSFDGTLFVAAIVENAGATNAINPDITVTGNGTQATATVFPVANLAAGTYTGRILFLVCSDPLCNNRVGGTPLPVDFTVTIQPGVRATPGSLTLSIESGNAVVEDLAVTLGTGESNFTIGTTAAFVQISNQTANGFRVTLPSLPVGIYNATIPLLGSNGSRSSIPITYTVTEPPGGQQLISVSPFSLTFTAPEGAGSQAQHLQVTDATWRPGVRAPIIHYSEGQNWLAATPVAGGFDFVADAANLPSGTYSALVIIASNPLPEGIEEPLGNSQQVFATLTVGPGFVQPADVVHVIDSETQLSQLHGDVDINLAGGPAVTWNAFSDVPWLQVSHDGVTGSALTYVIDQSFLSTAENFAEHVATITVNAPGTVLSPMQFAIRVQRRLAEVTGVGPHVQMAGQQTRLVVVGRGFAAVAAPIARVRATNAAPPASVQRVSDTKLIVTFDSLDPGEHVVRVSNALDFTTAARSVIAVTATPYAYSTVASGGVIQYLAVDYETDTLYGVRLGNTPAQGTLVRFHPSGGSNWVADVQSITAVDNVGVLPDGNVIVNTAPGGLTILDRNSMTPTFTLDLQCTGRHFRSLNMPVTDDGRVWLGQAQNLDCTGTPTFGRLGWLDTQALEFQLFEELHEPWYVQLFTDGPSFIMSRDGERLVIHQDSSEAFPPMVYLDASENVLRPTPQDQPAWFRSASASDDGTRILLDHDRLLNEQFQTIGRVQIPAYSLPFTDGAFANASVLSTDGSRAYVLTYPSSYLGQSPTPPTPLPRVWVLDTSGNVGDSPLPVLGYFELADYPNCIDDTNGGCGFGLPAAISLDGHTLFFAGGLRLVVTPIPPEGTLNDALAGPNTGAQMKPQPWRVSTH